MSNFYREFTKDIQRRLNSRAFDIKPQQVLSNEVQIIADLEREYTRYITYGFRIQDVANDPALFTTGLVFNINIARLNGSVAMLPGNDPVFDLTRDEIDRIEVLGMRYYLGAFNPTGLITSTNHVLAFGVNKFGNAPQIEFRDFQHTRPASTIAPSNTLRMDSIQGPFNTGQSQASNNGLISPIALMRERVIESFPNVPGIDYMENQLAFRLSHTYTAGETQTTLFTAYCMLHLKLTYGSPYDQVQIGRYVQNT